MDLLISAGDSGYFSCCFIYEEVRQFYYIIYESGKKTKLKKILNLSIKYSKIVPI